jgi:hypothetical protein
LATSCVQEWRSGGATGGFSAGAVHGWRDVARACSLLLTCADLLTQLASRLALPAHPVHRLPMAAAAAVAAVAVKRKSVSYIEVPDEPWLLALPGVLLPTEPALYPQQKESRHGSAEQLPHALQQVLADTPVTSVLHPCHQHPLTSFRITGAQFATSCDFCGGRCSSTEKPDLIMKLTVDTTHAADVDTVWSRHSPPQRACSTW